MIEMDIFEGDRVELLNGEVWHTRSSDLYRWSLDQYHRLGEVGFFDGERVELLHGLVWKMAPQKTPHFSAIQAAADTLEDAFGEGFTLRQQGPLTLPDGTEPEPDILIVPGSWRDYVERHPTREDVRLLVEVSDSTLDKDRGSKAADYAQAGVEDYWIINLVDRRLEVYRQPSPEGVYADVQVYRPSEAARPLHAPGKYVFVLDLLPPVKQNL